MTLDERMVHDYGLCKDWCGGRGVWRLAGCRRLSAQRRRSRSVIGEGPFITGGAFFVAREKGYFKKVEHRDRDQVASSTARSAVPSMIAGELDIVVHDAERQPVQQRRQGRAAGGRSRPRQQQEGLRLYGR